MTGIYALYFYTPDLVYIGSSIDINSRINRHYRDLSSGKHCNKAMQQAYYSYGIPEYILLEECKSSELTYLEDSWILEFDSINIGLNITTATNSGGVTHSTAKYSKRTILRVFSLLVNTKLSQQDIADKTNTSRSIVADIKNGRKHLWLKDDYPLRYAVMKSRYGGYKGSGVVTQ